MKKINSYPVLFFLLILLFSCHSNEPDFSKIVWKQSGNDDGISYSISKTTNGDKGQLHITYNGLLNNDKFEPDSLSEFSKIADNLFAGSISEQIYLKELPKGSEGYIRFDVDDYLKKGFADATHYTLFYLGNTNAEDLKKDSIKLLSLNLFKSIKIVSQDEALDAFNSNSSDTTWKNFLDNNPLPSSINLTLKKNLFLAGKLDSVKNVLTELFPNADLSSNFENKDHYLTPLKKKILIYNFTVL